jgi:hypothetical protein
VKALVIAAMLVVAHAGVAFACGGGGGGGGGGGHGGGGHSSCKDTSDTVGISHCRHFGAWAQEAELPRFIFGMEIIDHQFLTPPVDVTGTVAHEGTTYTFRVSSMSPSTAPVHANALAVRIRLGGVTKGPFYGAIETDLGGLTSGPTLGTEGMADGYQPTYDSPYTMYSAFHGVVGARAKLGMLALSAELAGGLRMLTFMVSDQLGSCASSGSAVIATGELEARARADVWVSPHMTVGASVGTSLIDRDDRTIAVGITGHMRAFDGAR